MKRIVAILLLLAACIPAAAQPIYTQQYVQPAPALIRWESRQAL